MAPITKAPMIQRTKAPNGLRLNSCLFAGTVLVAVLAGCETVSRNAVFKCVSNPTADWLGSIDGLFNVSESVVFNELLAESTDVFDCLCKSDFVFAVANQLGSGNGDNKVMTSANAIPVLKHHTPAAGFLRVTIHARKTVTRLIMATWTMHHSKSWLTSVIGLPFQKRRKDVAFFLRQLLLIQ